MGQPDDHRRLTAAVRAALQGVDQGVHVVVATSGGADSVALLHLLVAARPDLQPIVGHVRHGLRDDAADAAAAVAAATALGVPSIVRPVQVGKGQGPEDAARRARHDALAAIAAQAGAQIVLLGHTADDQAETLLLRIARGTGPDGLAGMAAESWRGDLRLLRPLLGLRRADVRAVLPPGTWVEDPTNADPDQRRARARHDVLPALSRLRPDEGDVVPALVRLAALARADRDLVDALAAHVTVTRYGPALLVPRGGGVVPGLRGAQACVLRRAWQMLPSAPLPPSAAALDRVLDLPHGRSTQIRGGIRVTASAAGWVLDPTGGRPLPARALSVGGQVLLPEHGILLRCTRSTAADPAAGALRGPAKPPHAATLDPAPWVLHLPDAPGPLVVSGRDRGGARDIRDDLRTLVPVGLRHLVPVLRDADGRALAVGSRALVRPDPGHPGLLVSASPSDGAGVVVG